jgi:hypothetical protein
MQFDLHPVRWNPEEVQQGFSIGIFGPIVAVVWRGAVTVEAVSKVAAVLERTARRSPQAIGFLTVAQFKAPIPPADVRESIVDCYRRLGPKLACVAQVVEGDGFWACGARCFIAGLGLLAKRDQPTSVFGEVDSAVAWMGRWVSVPLDVDHIANGVGDLRLATA